MDEAIEYIWLKIEESYFDLNPDMIGRDYCIHEEGVPCNCITGIILNYVGYIAKRCLGSSDYKNSINMVEGNFYIRTKIGDKEISPVFWREENGEFYLQGQSCDKSAIIGKEVYFPFRNYKDVGQRIKDNAYSKKILGPVNDYRLKFWVLFLKAVRVKAPEIKQKALLAMAIFLFPEITLQMIYDFLRIEKAGEAEKEKLLDFIEEYKIFLNNLSISHQFNFFFFFSKEFENMTKVNIFSFIEAIVDNAPDTFLLEIMWSAYGRNKHELQKRRGLFRKIENAA